MAAPMWRMNGVWKRMAGVLLLCTLLLCNEVMCQDDPGANSTGGPAAADPDATNFTASLYATTVAAVAGSTRAFFRSTALPFTRLNTVISQNGPTSGTTAAPNGEKEVLVAAGAPEFFVLSCVDREELKCMPCVMVSVETANCEETIRIIEENRPAWCKERGCDLKLYQDGKTLHAGSNDGAVGVETLKNMFLSEPLQGKLMSSPSAPPSSSSSSSGSSVFVGVLVSGLLAAAAITAGYCKCQRRSDTKGVKLAEEAYPVDQENQGNTLVSVAPLNPPTETLEKPSVNGESPEAVKTEPTPPTNGHSTTNTADTEM